MADVDIVVSEVRMMPAASAFISFNGGFHSDRDPVTASDGLLDLVEPIMTMVRVGCACFFLLGALTGPHPITTP
jgi:hypothetical protein